MTTVEESADGALEARVTASVPATAAPPVITPGPATAPPRLTAPVPAAAPSTGRAPEPDTPPPAAAPPAQTLVAKPAGPASTFGRLAALSRTPPFRALGVSLLLLSAFLLGFAAYLFGLSGTVEARSQATLFTQLRYELGQATAPVGPTTPGMPVAILDFPGIGIRNLVVVEGTTPENLMLGPGLVRNTPLPGQAGVSEIYGRLATFGAPFSHLGELSVGEEIKVITGQGTAIYRIAAFGDSAHIVVDPAPNRLILLTAGSPYVPTYFSYVDADLASAVRPQPGGLPAIYTDETALSGDQSALVLTLLWGIALAGVSALSTVGAARWSPWPSYLASAPVLLVVLWNLYHSLAALLPNVY